MMSLRQRIGSFALLAALTVAPRAHAQTIAYVTTLFGSIDYSQSSPGGNYSLASLGTGQYQITFYGAGNSLNSNVQVTAVDWDLVPHYCTAGSWGSSSGTDVIVNVDCFDVAGNPLNEDFDVFYQARTGALGTGEVAFLWGDQPSYNGTYTPDTDYNYNSSGVYNTVFRNGPGNYYAFLPGVHRNGGNPQVTAYGNAAGRCEVVGWYHNHVDTIVDILCVNAAGQAQDSYFSLAFSYGATLASAPDQTLGGYAWANNDTSSSYVPVKPYQWNNVSTRKLTAQNISGGTSFMNMRVPEGVVFQTVFGMVTAYGLSGEYCDQEGLGYYGTRNRVTLTLTVDCFNAQGQPLNTLYDAQFITSE